MKLKSQCSKCKKMFDLEVNDKDSDILMQDYLNKRFKNGVLLCPKCEQ